MAQDISEKIDEYCLENAKLDLDMDIKQQANEQKG